MTEIKNAKIINAWIGIEDHGILTATIQLDMEGNLGGSFGGYALDYYDKEKKERVGHKACGIFIRKILDICEADSWEDINGKCIRVRIEDRMAKAIGHIVKDEWFYPARDKEFRED